MWFIHNAQMSVPRFPTITNKGDLDFSALTYQWAYPDYNVKRDLFYPNTIPKCYMIVSLWVKMLEIYCKQYYITKERSMALWLDIVENIMAINIEECKPPDAFKAWAYGNLCKLILEERIERNELEYDPEHPRIQLFCDQPRPMGPLHFQPQHHLQGIRDYSS